MSQQASTIAVIGPTWSKNPACTIIICLLTKVDALDSQFSWTINSALISGLHMLWPFCPLVEVKHWRYVPRRWEIRSWNCLLRTGLLHSPIPKRLRQALGSSATNTGHTTTWNIYHSGMIQAWSRLRVSPALAVWCSAWCSRAAHTLNERQKGWLANFPGPLLEEMELINRRQGPCSLNSYYYFPHRRAMEASLLLTSSALRMAWVWQE